MNRQCLLLYIFNTVSITAAFYRLLLKWFFLFAFLSCFFLQRFNNQQQRRQHLTWLLFFSSGVDNFPVLTQILPYFRFLVRFNSIVPFFFFLFFFCKQILSNFSAIFNTHFEKSIQCKDIYIPSSFILTLKFPHLRFKRRRRFLYYSS